MKKIKKTIVFGNSNDVLRNEFLKKKRGEEKWKFLYI